MPISGAAPLALVHGCGPYESGERVENSSHPPRVFESISSVSPFGLIAYQLCKPQCTKDIAGARHAAANRSCDLTGAHLFTIRQQKNHGEGSRVSEKTAQARLPIAYFFRGRNAYHVFAIAKT
jgi:hypothetical protein